MVVLPTIVVSVLLKYAFDAGELAYLGKQPEFVDALAGSSEDDFEAMCCLAERLLLRSGAYSVTDKTSSSTVQM